MPTVNTTSRVQEKRKSLHRTLLWLAFPSVVGGYLLCSLISYGWPGTISTKGFELLGSGRMPGFDDIKWLLSFSACEGNLQELISKNATCFDYNNPGYPTLSMELGRWLGLGPSHAGWLGLIGGAGVTTVLAHAFWLCTGNIRSWSIITGILGLSYPYQLLVERGNLDSVILLLVALFCLIIWLPGAASILLANVVTAFAIALKIYPAILTAAWLVYSLKAPMESRRKRILNLSLLATTAAALLFTFTTIHGRMDSASGGLSSHGLTAIGYANMFLLREFGYTVGRIFIYSLYALKTLSILGGLWGGLIYGKNLTLPKHLWRTSTNPLALHYILTFVMITSALGLGCYITTINYDYRLVFLFPLISLIISNLLDGRTLRPENKQFLTMLAGASAYILILPFTRSLALSSGTYLELIDEMIVAPFLFSGLAAIWINLHQSPPEKPAFHQTAFPQQIGS